MATYLQDFDEKHTIYTKSVVEDHESENSKKWISLLLSDLDYNEQLWCKNELLDVNQWLKICNDAGFVENNGIKIYSELPVPDTDKFPFENEIAQWMTEYVFNSIKP